MPELLVRDIFHEYVDEIESDFKKIKEVYGETGIHAEDIIYRQLLGCTHDLQRKYFGYVVG
jgi:hypothetical protein